MIHSVSFETYWLKLGSSLTTHKTQNNSSKVFVVGICNPVHYCVNAFLATHKCTFAICSKCKNNLEEHEYLLQGSAKRTRRALHNTSKRANSAAGLKEALNKNIKIELGEKRRFLKDSATKITTMIVVTWNLLVMILILTVLSSSRWKKVTDHFQLNVVTVTLNFAKNDRSNKASMVSGQTFVEEATMEMKSEKNNLNMLLYLLR